ncbi:MAG TPA: hypothetical protein DEH78_13255 [Solibacterales bacterium]|nr:hypothetical protein [Bryobacterales bacterium]
MGAQIFLSTVSDEFRTYRDTLRHDLDRPNVSVKVQEDFIAAGSETLEKLDEYIRQCDAVIHLVGDMTGSIAKPQSVSAIVRKYPDIGTRLPPLQPFLNPSSPGIPYTQWEAWLALYHLKRLIIAVPTEDAERDATFRVDEAQRAAQREHLERFKAVERYPEIYFRSVDRLAVGVMSSRILDLLASKHGGVHDDGLGRYLDAVHNMRTHGYLFARNAATNGAFLYVSLRGQPKDTNLTGVEPTSLDKLLASPHQSILLKAEAGAGKTTLLRHLARCAWWSPSSIGLERPMLPAYVRLRCVAQTTGASLSERLKNALDLGDDIQTGGAIGTDFLDRWQANAGCKWLLLLDAIDEVAESDREAVFEWIAQVLDKGFRLIVTSRHNLQVPQRLEPRMTVYTISPLSQDEQTLLVEGLLRERSAAFRAVLEQSNSMWLRENPLLLSLAAFVFDRTDTLPRRRVGLYEGAVSEWLTHAESRSLKADVPPDLKELIPQALGSLAFAMTNDNRLLTVDELTPLVAETLVEFSNKPLRYLQLADVGGRLVRALGRHTGFFEVRGNHCAWIHATFREFFAAKHIAFRMLRGEAQAEIFKRTGDPAWRHVLLMLLTLLGDKVEIDTLITTMAATGPDDALFAAQAVLEGARVSDEAAFETVQLLAAFTAADSEQSLCEALLTAGHEQKKDRLRLLRHFAADPKHDQTMRWLKAWLVSRCRESVDRLERRLGWNPQTFAYLQELNARDELIELCDDSSAADIVRAIALVSIAKLASDSVTVRLESLLATSKNSSAAMTVLACLALESGRSDLALLTLTSSCLSWKDTVFLLESVKKQEPLPQVDALVRLGPHPRAMIAIAAQQEDGLIEPEMFEAMRHVISGSMTAEKLPPLVGEGPPPDVFMKLIQACSDEDPLNDSLIECAAREDQAIPVLHLLAASMSPEQFERWTRRESLSVGAVLVLLDGFLNVECSAEDLAVLESAFTNWYTRTAPKGDAEKMRRFLEARIAIKKENWVVAKEALTTVRIDPTAVLPVGSTMMSLEFDWGATSMLARIHAEVDDDIDSAVTTLKDFLASSPNHFACRTLLAELLGNAGRFEEAVSEYEWIMHHRFGALPSQLAEVAEAVGQSYVLAQAMRVGLMGSDNPFAEHAGKFDFDRSAMARFALCLLRIDRFEDASTVAGALIEDRDWLAVGHRLRGAARLVIDPARALEDLDISIEAEEDNSYARLTRAYLHRLNGDYADARADLERVLKAVPRDDDALDLLLEMQLVTGPLNEIPDRVAELEVLGVRGDLLRFAEICASGDWSAVALMRLEAAVREAYGELVTEHSQLSSEGVAHLVVYAVAFPDLADLPTLIDAALNGHHLMRLVQTTLPLCRHLREIHPESRERADEVIARIDGAVAAKRESNVAATPDVPVYPKRGTYPFPMYCPLSHIGGLEREKRRCDELLREHAQLDDRMVVVIRIDPDKRIYVQCTFKNETHAEHKFKFCDEVSTTTVRNLRTLVVDFGVRIFLFTDEPLRKEFEEALRRQNLSAATKLIS